MNGMSQVPPPPQTMQPDVQYGPINQSMTTGNAAVEKTRCTWFDCLQWVCYPCSLVKGGCILCCKSCDMIGNSKSWNLDVLFDQDDYVSLDDPKSSCNVFCQLFNPCLPCMCCAPSK